MYIVNELLRISMEQNDKNLEFTENFSSHLYVLVSDASFEPYC